MAAKTGAARHRAPATVAMRAKQTVASKVTVTAAVVLGTPAQIPAPALAVSIATLTPIAMSKTPIVGVISATSKV